MHIPLVTILLWILTVVLAYPLARSGAADIQVLAFADVLEQLESAFYTQALEQFNASSFAAAGFASSQIPIQQIQAIASDESTHSSTLQSAIHALGGQAISNCTFDFSSVLTEVGAMISTARTVEDVGVSTYLGALTSLAHPALVTIAGSIMTVEARHQTILNLLSNATSIPQPSDVALAPGDALTIVNAFISGCKLGISANPPLTVTNSGPLQAGTELNFSSPALNWTNLVNQLSCKIVTGRSNAPIYQPMNGCMVPANVTGPMYVFITDDQITTKSPSNMNGTTNPSTVVAGPALLFVNQPDFIGNLIRPGLSATGATSGSQTIASTALCATPSVTATSALPVPTRISAAPTTYIPSLGVFTTTISIAQASALLSGLVS